MKEMQKETNKFITQYEDFSFLWKEDLEESFQKFIDSGEMPTGIKKKKANNNEEGQEGDEEEEIDEAYQWMANKILTGVQVKKPSLDKFDEKISYLFTIKHKIDELITTNDIGWLKVNSAPLKSGIQNIINSWIKKYTNFLLNNTLKEIANIKKFIQEVSDGIKKVPENAESHYEKDLLMKVMTHLRDVKMIKDKTMAEIDPMKVTVVLLKKHGVTYEEDLLIDLENMKTRLVEVSENALGPVKEQILPLQKIQADNIKHEIDEFKHKVEDFRRRFIENCPYHTETATPDVIDRAY